MVATVRHKVTRVWRTMMNEKHQGRCHICKTKPYSVIDHDHRCCPGRTGCMKCARGLLCTTCNTLLGMAHDDVMILQAAIDYLNGED